MSTPYDPSYDFGTQEPGEHQQDTPGIRDLREHLKEVSSQLKEMKAENQRLQAERRQAAVADALKAKGFAPAGAQLYTGEPEKLDDWLSAHGAALAKLPATAAPEGGQETQRQDQGQPAGPPTTTVPQDQQQAMNRFAEAGADAAPPAGSDEELASQIAQFGHTPDGMRKFEEFMRSQGNRFF